MTREVVDTLFLFEYPTFYPVPVETFARRKLGSACFIQNGIPESENEKVGIAGEGQIVIEYDRDDLRLYKYPNIQPINVLIKDITVKINGTLIPKSNSSPINYATKIHTEVEGSATVTENSTLSNCDLDLRSTASDDPDLTFILQEKLFYLSKSCIETTICDQIGKVQQDDFLLTSDDEHDFGDKSVLYTKISEKFPNLDLSKPNNLATLQTTINIITDILIANVVNRVSLNGQFGKIELPNVHEVIQLLRVYQSSRKVILIYPKELLGKLIFHKKFPGNVNFYQVVESLSLFGMNINHIHRNGDVKVILKGLHLSINIELELPNAQIHFDTYKIKLLLMKSKGDISINIDKIRMGLEIDVNYNKMPCQVNVNYILSRIEGIHPVMPKGNFMDNVLTKAVDSLMTMITPNLVSFLKLKLKQAISIPLDSFNCEPFRL
ncbi:hypothetical protein QAD02_000960 [Eretmocerus hayati]|uniref:Uncharacterized protein n=1 Tax=Eretmocerus hayati TaxID=131215 RepID=A0ACC2NGB6_9HYME|nr:hypothetical protein QAD02_000960 [Eretmocerus hayati]